jgi:hypothetical protein
VLLAADLAAVTAVAATAGHGHGRTAWSLTLVAAGLTVALLLVQGGSLADRPTEGREARLPNAVTVQGMPRVRVSTTVDADSLRAARQRTGGRDSELFDQALLALLDALDAVDAEAELEALTTAPQGERPESPPAPGPDDLSTPDDGAPAPADVVQLADHRRARRAR